MQKRIPFHFHIIFLCLSFPLAAQEMPDKTQWKNEIGLTLFSVNSSYGLYEPSSYYLSGLNGIRYTRHMGRNAIRFGVDYRNSREDGRGNVIGTGTYREGKFSLGYQREYFVYQVRPYIAMDMMYMLSALDSEYHGGCFGFYTKENIRDHGIGFAPALGITYPFNEHFSIAWEGNLECLWISEKGSVVLEDHYDPGIRNTYPVDKDEFICLLNPIKRIALKYGF